MFASRFASSSRTLRTAPLAVAALVLPLTACGGGAEPAPDGAETASASETGTAAGAESAATSLMPKAPAATQGAGPEAMLGGPLTVGDTTIPVSEIKRAMVLGTHGRQLLEAAKLGIFIEEEIEKQIASGHRTPEYFQISEDEIEQAMDRADQAVKEEYEGIEGAPQTASDVYHMPADLWEDQFRRSELFSKVFLPDDPREYAETTIAALNSQTEGLVDKLIEGHETRLAEGIEVDPNDQGHMLFKTLMSQLIIAQLGRAADVQTVEDGLPVDVAMIVNGKKILVEDVWEQMKYKVTPTDVAETRTWLAKTTACRQQLQDAGYYLTDEEFEKLYFEHTDPYKDSPFNIPAMAMTLKKFPSEQAYMTHFRLQESLKDMIADELNEETLAAHNEARAKNLLGLARVDVDVILISAYDFPKQKFKENGWEEAAQRAKQAMQKLADGVAWSDVLEEHSEWYEPPVGKSNQHMKDQYTKNKGRFGLMNRNELMQKLGESEWSQFLSGDSITDTIFFDLEPGIPSQPLKGPHGYYIALVRSRTAPTQKISLDNEGHRNLIEQDYMTVRMNTFAEESLQAVVGG